MARFSWRYFHETFDLRYKTLQYVGSDTHGLKTFHVVFQLSSTGDHKMTSYFLPIDTRLMFYQ